MVTVRGLCGDDIALGYGIRLWIVSPLLREYSLSLRPLALRSEMPQHLFGGRGIHAMLRRAEVMALSSLLPIPVSEGGSGEPTS